MPTKNTVENKALPIQTDSGGSVISKTENNLTNSILTKKEDENQQAVKSAQTEIVSAKNASNKKETSQISRAEDVKEKTSPASLFSKNRLFISLSIDNGVLFSTNIDGNILAYGALFTAGIQNTKRHFSVETGVGWQALEYRVPYSRTMYISMADGTSDSLQTVSRYKYSRRSLLIPFHVAKEIYRFNDALSLHLKAGVNTRITLSQQRLFAPAPWDVETVEKQYFPMKATFSLIFAPQLQWNAGRKTAFFIQPQGVIFLNSLYQNTKVKPYGATLSAGIFYRF